MGTTPTMPSRFELSGYVSDAIDDYTSGSRGGAGRGRRLQMPDGQEIWEEKLRTLRYPQGRVTAGALKAFLEEVNGIEVRIHHEGHEGRQRR